MTSENRLRFSTLDACILFCGPGMGWIVGLVIPVSGIPSAWAGNSVIVERAVILTLRGLVIAGPLILLTHYTVRHRRTSLALGEWLWIVQGTLWLVFWLLGTAVPSLGFLLFAGMIWAQAIIFLVAVPTFFGSIVKKSSASKRLWTSTTGSLVNAIVASYFFLDLWLYPVFI